MKGKPENGTRKKKKHRVSNWILVLILLIGLGIFFYPSFSEYWNSLHQSRAILGYAERVAEMSNEEYETIWNASIEYNERLLDLIDERKPELLVTMGAGNIDRFVEPLQTMISQW